MGERTHVYAEEPDVRQTAEAKLEGGRFRKRYKKLNEEEITLHDAIKDKASELEDLFNKVRPGRDRSLAFTHLEDSIMRIIREITSP